MYSPAGLAAKRTAMAAAATAAALLSRGDVWSPDVGPFFREGVSFALACTFSFGAAFWSIIWPFFFGVDFAFFPDLFSFSVFLQSLSFLCSGKPRRFYAKCQLFWFVVNVDVVVDADVVVVFCCCCLLLPVVVAGRPRVGGANRAGGASKFLHCREEHCKLVKKVTDILHVSLLNLHVAFK
jgi:hypothetical protein